MSVGLDEATRGKMAGRMVVTRPSDSTNSNTPPSPCLTVTPASGGVTSLNGASTHLP